MSYVVCVGEISMSWEIAWRIYDIWKNIKKNRRLVFAFCQINFFRAMYMIFAAVIMQERMKRYEAWGIHPASS